MFLPSNDFRTDTNTFYPVKKVLIISTLLLASLFASAQDCVQKSYTAEIGVREATGRNDGKEVEKYLASTGLGKGYAWCAAFVNWNLVYCGYDTPKSPAWSPSWFAKSNVIYHRGVIMFGNRLYRQPQQSDVFGIYFQNKKRIAHVGFVDIWTAKRYFVTVEGNTNEAGSREGDGVYRKYRLKSQVYKIARWT